MQLSVRHLSGSKAGQVEQFAPAQRVTVGRHPSSHLRFDPTRDLTVSGHHAELWIEGGSWKLRDLGSSNGTFISGNRITEAVIHPGDVIQFGLNGPQLQFDYAGAVPATEVVPLPARVQQDQPVPEGRTVAMMLNPVAPGAPQPHIPGPAVPQLPRRKKKLGTFAKVAITLVVIFGILFAALAAAIVMRRNSLRKKRMVTIESKQKVEAEKVVQAMSIRTEMERTNQEIAAQQVALAASENPALAETIPPTGTVIAPPASADASEDLRRQLDESQRMAEELARQLQKKNDEIAAIRADKVRLSTARAPQPKRPAPAPAAPRTTPTAAPVAEQRAPAPVSKPVPVAVPIPQPIVPPVFGALDRTKNLKRKITLQSLSAEIGPADMPANTPKELATLVGQGLIADGGYVTDSRGLALVQVMVTNYVATKRTNVDVKALSNTASRIGALAGKDIGRAPVGARSVTYDAMMSAKVQIIDRSGRILDEFSVSSQAHDTKSKASLDGIPFAQVVGSDSAPGDVGRDVVGQIIERLRGRLGSFDWTEPITAQKGSDITLAAGRNSNIEVDDVFEVLDGSNVIALARVSSVEQTSSVLTVASGTTSKLQGKAVRFAGHTGDVPSRYSAPSVRTFVAAKNSKLYAGPGFSFQEVRELKNGVRLPVDFAVGPWARVTEGSKSYWVPLVTGRIE